MKTIWLILTMAYGLNSFAEVNNAKVIMVRGDATKLLPGSKSATPVKKGELIPEDTSIVTKEKSIVKLTFEDKSSVNIGPNSMLVVSKMQKKQANMLNLLTGAIKSEVDKRNQKEESNNKMIIKTRSAVMGVRGTKFQTIYNPANKTTSLVTIEGKVAMVKRTQAPPKIVEKVVEAPVDTVSSEVAKETTAKTVEKIAVAKTPEEELAELDKTLDTSKEAVEVTEGKYSGVGETVTKPTEPVKIAPKQYDALAKSMNSTKKAEEVMKLSEAEAATDVVADAAAPRPGGYVDFQTGLYVAPPEDSKLDTSTGTYKSDEIIGSVDEVTGDYVPPEGVELDAKKGFIIKEDEAEKVASADKEKLQETIAKLNNEVKKQVIVNEMEETTANDKKWYKPDSHLVSLEFIPYSEFLTVKNNDSNSEAEFYSSSAKKVFITWGQQWSENTLTRISMGGSDLTWEKPDGAQLYDNGTNGEFFKIGFDYKWSEKFLLKASIVNETVFYVYSGFQGSGSVNSSKDNFSYLDLSTNYFLYDWKMFKVNLDAGLKLYTETKTHINGPSAQDATAQGFYLGMSAQYSWSKSLALTFGGWFDRTVIEVDNYDFTKLQFGTSANLIWNI